MNADPAAGRRLRVLIFRDAILPLSQNFVINQALSMPAEVLLLGSHRVPGIEVELDKFVIEDVSLGRLRSFWFRATRRSHVATRRARRFKPDVVLAHFAQDGFRVAKLARALGVPLVVVAHGGDVLMSDEAAKAMQRTHRALASRWPELIAQTALFLPASDFLAAALNDRGVPRRRIRRHYIGVSVPDLDVERAMQTHRASRTILFVGRLVPSKGVDHLIKAVSRLRSTSTWRLVVVGDGPERNRLEALAGSLGVLDRTKFAGALPFGEVQHLMSISRILCAPSVVLATGESEGLNLGVLEGAAQGLPSIYFATGGLPEAAGSGGLQVPRGDTDSFSGVLQRIIDSDDEVERLGRNARLRVELEFDVSRQSENLVGILRTLVGLDGH